MPVRPPALRATPPGALALALAMLLAGCLGAPTAAPVDPAAGLPAPADLAALMAGVPCEVEEVGPDTSANVVPLGLLDLAELGGVHGELDVRGDLLLAARYGEGGFDVVSLRDPVAPVLVGTYAEAPGGLDVKFLPDGRGAVVGYVDGVDVVDLRDPALPAKESSWAFPPDAVAVAQNAHMLATFDLDGRTLVFVAPNSDSGVIILELTGEPGARELQFLARFADGLNGPLGPHDMWATWDEDLDLPVLYVANGFYGWLAADVSDPANPQLLGAGLPLDPYQGYHHTIQAAKVGGRRLVATISEVGANALKVWDASNLLAPVPLATWTSQAVPVGPQHNVQIVGDKLVMAHYTEGVYVFDLAALPAAPVNGLWGPMAHWRVGDGGGGLLAFGDVWDVVVRDGLVYAGEMDLGVHVLGFGCFPPGDPAYTSQG